MVTKKCVINCANIQRFFYGRAAEEAYPLIPGGEDSGGEATDGPVAPATDDGVGRVAQQWEVVGQREHQHPSHRLLWRDK